MEKHDLEKWLAHYGTGPLWPDVVILQFGANSEIEDPLLRLQRRPVIVFDDAMERCTVLGAYGGHWADGVEFVRARPHQQFWVVCGVCSTPVRRQRALTNIAGMLGGLSNWSYYGFTASTAIRSQYADVDKTAMILDGAMVMANARLGPFSVLLPGAAVYHYSQVDDYSIIVGGAVVLGRAYVKRMCRICAGAIVLPGARIGPSQTVGAGCVVKALGDDEGEFMG